MARIRLFLLAALLAASPAFAAGWNTGSIKGGEQASFDWLSTDATTDQPALDVRGCGEIAYSSEVTGSPTVTLFLVATATTATASGTLVGTVTATARNLSAPVTLGPYFLRPNIGAVGTGGRIVVRCAAFARAFGAGGQQGVTLANLGGAAPTNCAVQGDIHQDLDTGKLWLCTIAATNTFIESAHTYSFDYASTTVVDGNCMISYGPGNSGSQSCALGSNAHLTTHALFATAGRTIVMTKLSCFTTGGITLVAAGEELRVTPVWKQGNGAGTYVETVAAGFASFGENDDDAGDGVVTTTPIVSPYTGSQSLSMRYIHVPPAGIGAGTVLCSAQLSEF